MTNGDKIRLMKTWEPNTVYVAGDVILTKAGRFRAKWPLTTVAVEPKWPTQIGASTEGWEKIED